MTTPEKAFNVRGKGRHYEHPDGRHVPSVTNIIGVLDKPAIPRWAAKMVAEQAWKLRHSLDSLGEAEAIDVLKGSPWRGSKRAADRGTTVHDYMEAVANDEHDRATKIADGLKGQGNGGYVEAAEAFLDLFEGSQILDSEVTVFGDDYAGTFDALWMIDGKYVLVDYKTGKDIYPEVELQLAALAYASETQAPSDAMAVLFRDDGTFKTKRWTFDELRPAFVSFLGCLDVWRWQKGEAA